MLEKQLDNMFKNSDFDFSDMKIDYIKEDEEWYVIYFTERVESVGNNLIYRIKKSNGEVEVVLPFDFDFVDRFEDCNFVQIPKKYKGKWF